MSQYLGESEGNFAQPGFARQVVIAKPASRSKSKRIVAIFLVATLAFGILFALTLLASGLSSSALGTIAGQVMMEGLIGKHWNIWARRIITRMVNVFPTTIAILLGLSPLVFTADTT